MNICKFNPFPQPKSRTLIGLEKVSFKYLINGLSNILSSLPVCINPLAILLCKLIICFSIYICVFFHYPFFINLKSSVEVFGISFPPVLIIGDIELSYKPLYPTGVPCVAENKIWPRYVKG